MDCKDWLMLKVIAEEKNITKAANRLYISQPALTHRLKNIEREFGFTILVRTSKGVLFTPQGDYLLAYSLEMLERLARVKEQAQNIGEDICGTIRIGSSAVIAHYELPGLLKNFLQQYPKAEISLKTGLSQKIYRLLQKHEIAVAIVRGEVVWIEEKYLLFQEPICLVSNQPISKEELLSRPRIMAQTDPPLQDMCEKWWQQNFNKSPYVTMELDSMETCRQMIVHGFGWAILPTTGLSKYANLYTQPLYWSDGQPLERPTWLLCHSASLDLSIIRKFVQYVRNYFVSREKTL